MATIPVDVQIWNAETGETLNHLPINDKVFSQSVFSPDGKQVAISTMEQGIVIWDVATATRIRTLGGSLRWNWPQAFSPDSTKLVTNNSDGTLRVWQVE